MQHALSETSGHLPFLQETLVWIRRIESKGFCSSFIPIFFSLFIYLKIFFEGCVSSPLWQNDMYDNILVMIDMLA